MRIRSIKPEFWRSDDIASLDWETRLFFIGLWSYVDDNGVGIDRLASIAADLFSGDLERDPPETFARVSRGLQTLSDAGRITRYTVENKAYLEITNWSKHQRIDKPNKARFPRSDDDAAVFRETLARVTGKEASGTGEQGNRGTGEQGIETPLSPADADDGTLIPDTWTPNQGHRDKAASLHLDVDWEATRFRDHAIRTMRRLKNWNTGYTNWLRKQAEYAQQRGARGPVAAPRTTAAVKNRSVVEHFAALEAGQNELEN